MDAASIAPRLRALVRRFRRPIAALLVFLAVLCALSVIRPSPPEMRTVLVASHDLPAGSVLHADDVTAVDVPDAYAVPGAMERPDQAVGQLLSAPLAGGEPLTPTRLATGALTFEEGTFAVPVRLADADAAAVLSPGMRIDLVRGTQGRAEVVAESVRIITIPQRSTAFGTGTTSGSLLLVAADRSSAIRLAAASTDGDLAAVVR